jgi:hypothetical protein
MAFAADRRHSPVTREGGVAYGGISYKTFFFVEIRNEAPL